MGSTKNKKSIKKSVFFVVFELTFVFHRASE